MLEINLKILSFLLSKLSSSDSKVTQRLFFVFFFFVVMNSDEPKIDDFMLYIIKWESFEENQVFNREYDWNSWLIYVVKMFIE